MKMLEQLQQEKDFKLGKPWRLTDKHLTVVVPVVRTGSAGRREYILIEEVKDKVKLSDSGSIGSVKVTGTDKPVLARSGVVIEGIKSQNRVIETSTIIIPETTVDIPVKCVYASHPISPGARMEVSEMYAPEEIQYGLLASARGEGGQHTVWRAVSSFSSHSTPNLETPHFRRVASDDLLGNMRAVREFRKDVDEVISKMPVDLNGQCGIVVLNIDGILGMEMFDHPDSWQAASKAVARKYADVLAREGESPLFNLNEDAVQETVTTFLEQFKDAKERTISENARSKTVSVQTKDYIGEYVILNGEAVHVIITKNKPNTPDTNNLERLREEIPYWLRDSWRRRESTPPSDFPDRDPAFWYSMNASGTDFVSPQPPVDLGVLRSLRKQPKPWMALEREFKKSHRSTKTLSKNLKTALDLGLVETVRRPENGRSVYALSAQAEKDLTKLGLDQEQTKVKPKFEVHTKQA